MRGSQTGNALFLILIAVALFAALAYAVTQSGRGRGGIRKEEAALTAAQIASYAGALQATVDRMRVINSAQAWQMYFNQNVSKREDGSNVETALGSPADPTLYVFHALGGGATAQVFPSNVALSGTATNWMPGHTAVREGTMPGQGTTLSDIMLVVLRIPLDVCSELNSKFGVTGATSGVSVNYNGLTHAAPTVMADWTGTAGSLTNISGKSDFCLTYSGHGIYFHVLAAY